MKPAAILKTPFQGWRSKLVRYQHLLSVYSGLRCVGNRMFSSSLGAPPGANVITGNRFKVAGLGELQLEVHSRPKPSGLQTSRRFAMVSARQVKPTVWKPLYRYFCATSHFGTGHLELAFFEEDGNWWIHGVRNMAAANAHRLGYRRTVDRLSPKGMDEAGAYLLGFIQLARASGYSVFLAPPQVCVNLSVRPELLKYERSEQVKAKLYQRYARLTRFVESRT